MTPQQPPLGVYVHWPYCARICPYCDFNVVRDRGRSEQKRALTAAILTDLKGQAALTGPRELASIFFGGGTPSLMDPDDVARIIETARGLWTPAGAWKYHWKPTPPTPRLPDFRRWNGPA